MSLNNREFRRTTIEEDIATRKTLFNMKTELEDDATPNVSFDEQMDDVKIEIVEIDVKKETEENKSVVHFNLGKNYKLIIISIS